MVECGESDKIIKISGKMDKSDTYKGFSSHSKHFSNSLNQEWNITTKPFISVWFIHLSTYFYHIYSFVYM